MTARGSLVSLAAVLLLVGDPRLAAAQYPIFDAHIHYSRPDWDAYPPERALAILAQAGVRRAIVSSTPDDGTLRLYERAPSVVVPFLRPYRTRDDMDSWHEDTGVAAGDAPASQRHMSGARARARFTDVSDHGRTGASSPKRWALLRSNRAAQRTRKAARLPSCALKLVSVRPWVSVAREYRM